MTAGPGVNAVVNGEASPIKKSTRATNWSPSASHRIGEPPLSPEELGHYRRLSAQRVARADRAEAERLRRDGRELEAKAFERSAAEAERKLADDASAGTGGLR
jgi:hypothetical protein